jgi:hypothetical protein
MLRENGGIEDVPSKERAGEISREMADILEELSLGDRDAIVIGDDGTFEYYGSGDDDIEEGVDPMIAEMFSNSDDPYGDANDYANMIEERSAED